MECPADIPHPGEDDRIVILSGAGISAESGLPTFRGPDGLWEGHRVAEVATPQAWRRDPALVRRFYNLRRQALGTVAPNAAHLAIAEMQRRWVTDIITQNVDDLHERAGAENVLHLHGRLTEARSATDPREVVNIGYRDLTEDDRCSAGRALRPNIVWFGEPVTLFEEAARIASEADWLLIVGTSLLVYPAAALVHETPAGCRIVLIDPNPPAAVFAQPGRVWVLPATATVGVPGLLSHWAAM
jgi:NAD-dependent deacetylase